MARNPKDKKSTPQTDLSSKKSKKSTLDLKNIDYKAVLERSSKYRLGLISLIVVALFVFTYFKVATISNPMPDQVLIDEGKTKNLQKRITLDPELIEQIKSRNQRGTDVTPRNLGNENPFD